MTYFLTIDQGTTNSRAHIFSRAGSLVSTHEMALSQQYPQVGWVEQDPEEMWLNTLECCRLALSKSKLAAAEITAVGITNQRETTIIWNKKTGKPIYPAISWQDRRTAAFCQQLSQHKINQHIKNKTGLLLDSYFSASKIVWLLDNVPNARAQAERGELVFGTVDTFLLWRLTKARVHATDATNASRTLIFNIVTQQWDAELLNAFNIPASLLPVVLDSAADFGKVDAEFLGREIPVNSMVGDQQGATIGQSCFQAGMVKSTYGTGCFIVLNTGGKIIQSKNQLLSTVAYRLNNQVTYALEGSIFSAGSIIKWMRDYLKIIKSAAETETVAQKIQDTGGVYLVPAFNGLGAPYWDANARAAILGLSGGSGIEQIVRAGLEAIAYQTQDLLRAMANDYADEIASIRVDGGMAVNNWLLQFIADMVNVAVCRPVCTETTALGAAFLAGLQSGVYQSLEEIAHLWQLNKAFEPIISKEKRAGLYLGWKQAVSKVTSE